MDGKDGADGEVGKVIRLVATGALLTSSDHQFQVTLRGGEGGDGGSGGPGRPGVNGTKGAAGENGKVGDNGTKGDDGYEYNCDSTEGNARHCTDVITMPGNHAKPAERYGHESHCCHSGDCDTYKYRQWFAYWFTYFSDCDPTWIAGKNGTSGEGALTEAWEETGQTRLQAQKEAREGKEAMVERRGNGALRPCRRFP